MVGKELEEEEEHIKIKKNKYRAIVRVRGITINSETGDEKQKPVIKKDRISPVQTTCSTNRSPARRRSKI